MKLRIFNILQIGDKKLAGRSIEEIEEIEQSTIYLILRDDLSILPQNSSP